MLKKIVLSGWLVLLILEITFLFFVISQLHWSGPVQDFWGSISFIEKTLSSGNWFGADLWMTQNNHRLALPRLSFLVDYDFFHGRNHFLITISFIFLLMEGLIFYFLSFNKQSMSGVWLVYFPALAILLWPEISYNFLNTFNVQWIQCASLALSACVAYSYGLATGKNVWIISSIFLAILCCFTTFSLTSVWPALFVLLWLHAADKKQWIFLGSIFFVFAVIFVFGWPLDKNIDTEGHYVSPLSISLINNHENLWLDIFISVAELPYYLVGYISFPFGENFKSIIYLITIFSLFWFIISLYRYKKCSKNWQSASLLSVMFFVICLGISTGIGRGFIGELAYGIRFSPVVLLYWAAFLLHAMGCLFERSEQNKFLVINFFVLFLVLALGVFNAKKTSERLAEEHNRYGRMQMAYLTGNLHVNALYENLVPEWRATSFPGILAAIPHLKSHQWGIFHENIGEFVSKNSYLPGADMRTCMQVSLQEKPRNNDINIRNITIRHADRNMSYTYPYLLIYRHKQLIGAAFRQRYSPFYKNSNSVWIGMSSMPNEAKDNVVIAVDKTNNHCRVEIHLD